jgi:protein TonB
MLETPFSRHVYVKPFDWIVSFALHVLVVAALIAMPLYFTESIDLKAFSQIFLVGPPHQPPPPPAATLVQKIVRSPVSRFIQAGRLSAPVAIPKAIAMIKEEPLPPDTSSGAMGGVVGGIPGGQLGGVLSGIIGGTGSSASSISALRPPPPVKQIVRVGGQVKPPRLVNQPTLVYPALARNARVEGVVTIEAIIDENGDVVEARAVSGPGLLIPTALQAIVRWKYEPTLLNGEPVSVQMTVYVRYHID